MSVGLPVILMSTSGAHIETKARRRP